MIDEISTMISSVGFPIVAFYLMYTMCNSTVSKVNDSIQELKETLAELKGAISNDKWYLN